MIHDPNKALQVIKGELATQATKEAAAAESL